MKKFWNFIQNEDTSETELLFNGPISEDTWWGDEVTPALFRDELAKVSGNLTVWLNSPGGDVSSFWIKFQNFFIWFSPPFLNFDLQMLLHQRVL